MKNSIFSSLKIIALPILLGALLFVFLLLTAHISLLALAIYAIIAVISLFFIYKAQTQAKALKIFTDNITHGKLENTPSNYSFSEFQGINQSLQSIEDKLKSTQDELKNHISYDKLTSLYSRQGLIDKFYTQTIFSDSAVIMVSIDKFRDINDSLGHENANQVLRTISKRMQEILPDNYLLARFGGIDFAIYAPYITDETWIDDIVKRINTIFEQPIAIGSESIFVKQIIGSALLPTDHAIELGLRNANIALTYAKKDPLHYAMYNPEMTDASVKRTQIVAQIKQGLANKEFVPFYQPLIDLKTNRVMGAEALARWRTEDRGLIPPDEFIPLAEEYGLINEIGNQILRQACFDTKDAIDNGRWDEDFHIHVNVSVKQLLFSSFADDLKNILLDTKLPTKNLTLEITESNLLHESPIMEANLATIVDLGISLAIDDFGTGYSSLAYLQDMSFDSLKIDRSFIDRLDEETADKSIVSTILTLTRNIDVPVVSEGIETQEQAKILSRLGCQIAQGYYYSRPVPIEDWPYEQEPKK